VSRDSGYLRKNSRLLEKLMRRFGLGGQSLPPLLMGFGCNVPAIMALKHLPHRREKVITAMMIPFMSCSARLPVYTLLIAAFFAERWQGTVLFGIYLTGVLVAGITGLVLHRLLPRPTPDLPLKPATGLRLPRPAHIFGAATRVTLDFFWRIGRIIVPASIIMWALFAFPVVPQGEPFTGTLGGQIGQAIAPVFAPLGFDWRIAVALLTGVVAKETIISTMGVFLSLKHGETILSVTDMLRDPEVLTLPAALALLVFVLLYVPCVGVFAAIKQEVDLKWALVALVYPTVLAWVLAFVVYRAALLMW
jgi:ferrous iron transport protein B